jgi:glycosyltransferase involved in cell wall biosynthesis
VKVLFVDQYAQMGGGQRILLDIVEDFQLHGIQSSVALPEHGPLSELLGKHRVKVLDFPLPKMRAGGKSIKDQVAFFPAALRAAKVLRNHMEEEDADLVFCNGPRCALPVVLAASRLGLPVICAVHLIFEGKERALLSWCFRRRAVKAITFCSQTAVRAFPKLPADKEILVGNWVSPGFLEAPKHPRAKELFNLKQEDLAIGVVGRLSAKKGQRLFLEAMAPLAHGMANLKLLVAGSADFEDPEEETRLKGLAKDLGLSYHVHFLGNVPNTVALMDALDILAVPSVWEEPFGLAAVEGMARSLPVIATKSGGLTDIVVHGETGFLIEKDAAELRKAAKCLIMDPEMRAEFGRAARARACEVFGAARRLEDLRDLARNLIPKS